MAPEALCIQDANGCVSSYIKNIVEQFIKQENTVSKM